MNRLALAFSLLVSSSALAGGSSSPEKTVNDFYTWEIHGPFGSDRRLLGPVRHLLTKELDALMTATDNYQDACRKLVPPDTKPWILDGDPWYYYSSDSARAIDGAELVVASENSARVAAHLRYDDEFKWTDTVVLSKSGNSWRIADIRFQQGGGLIQSLRAYFSRACGRK